MSGSTCSINFASIAGAGAGPPAWIISQWKGGPPPLLTAAAGGGVYSGLYGCRGPAVATTTRRVRRGDTGETGAGMGAAVKRAWTSTYVQTTYTETVVSTKVLEGETVTRRGEHPPALCYRDGAGRRWWGLWTGMADMTKWQF